MSQVIDAALESDDILAPTLLGSKNTVANDGATAHTAA